MRYVNTRTPGDKRPDRATCLHCGRVIERLPDDTQWSTGKLGGLVGRDTECDQAPNPMDGPMPGHEPNGVIVHPPASL